MRILAMLMVFALTACVSGTAGDAKKPAAAANPITGGAIAVTTLDRPKAAAPDVAPKNPIPPPVIERPKPKAKPASLQDGTKEPPADEIGAKEVVPEPVRVVSAAEKTCLKQGGQWSKAGKSGAETCVKLTKDAGKRCDAESDCEGLCLARSGTCAPAIPMFGCNDILQDNGVQVTLCID